MTYRPRRLRKRKDPSPKWILRTNVPMTAEVADQIRRAWRQGGSEAVWVIDPQIGIEKYRYEP